MFQILIQPLASYIIVISAPFTVPPRRCPYREDPGVAGGGGDAGGAGVADGGRAPPTPPHRRAAGAVGAAQGTVGGQEIQGKDT